MPKDQIDDLIAAVAAVDKLQDIAAAQADKIQSIIGEIERVRERVAALEATAPRQAGSGRVRRG